jgi:nucleoside-diphosphate-sugar epimerase
MAGDIVKEMTRPTVLLTGASSQIGVFAIPRLLKAGFNVIAISRKGKPEAYPVFEQVQWMHEAKAILAVKDIHYLLSAGPLELAHNFLAEPMQLHTAVVFSSSSVESKKESDNPAEKRQIDAMLDLESELQKTAGNKGVKLVVLRPTLIYGCGLDANISRLASWIRRFGFLPVNGKAAGLRQPVHADDLASAAVAALQTETPLPDVITLSGGETLSYSEMLKKIFASMEKSPRLLRLPEWVFVLLVQLAGLFKFASGVNSEMVKRQKVDLVFDNEQASTLLDYQPRFFAPVMEDFSLPHFGEKKL